MKMTRRSMLAMTAATAVTPAVAAKKDAVEPGEIAKIPVPDHVKPAIAKAYARFTEWKGKDETVVFPLVSDLHAEGEPTLKVPVVGIDWWDSKIHLLYACCAARAFEADFFADLGDIGMDRWQRGGLPPWEAHMKPRMEIQYRLYENLEMPVLFAVGNHDLGHPQKTITVREWGECFNLRQKKERGGATELGPDGDYGFLDLAAKKTRILFLNTTSTGPMGKGISRAQTDWAEKAVAATPSGWRLVVLSHSCLHRNMGRWLPATLERPDGEGFAEIRAQLEKFATARRMPVCAFSGDSHFDNELTENNVTYAITQSYGTSPWQMLPPESRYHLLDRAHDLLVDMVALKPASGAVKVFRIGAGGELADRDLVRDPNRGTRKFVYSSGVARLAVPGVTKTVRFTVSADDARTKNLTTESRNGLRFVWLDNAGGEITKEQFEFFKREAESREPVALVLSVPLYIPGLSVEEAPCGHVHWKMPPDHPEIKTRTGWLGGGHSYTTFYFRWIVLHTPRLAGIFAAYSDTSFAACDEGAVECVAPAADGLKVVING